MNEHIILNGQTVKEVREGSCTVFKTFLQLTLNRNDRNRVTYILVVTTFLRRRASLKWQRP